MFKKQHVASVPDVDDCKRVHAACDRMEEFLTKAGPEIRDMVAIEMFESLQNAESSSDSDSFAPFLGPETKRLCADLQDRTVLEGEVLMSRILRQLSFEQPDLSHS